MMNALWIALSIVQLALLLALVGSLPALYRREERRRQGYVDHHA